jgi:hypothetical protein
MHNVVNTERHEKQGRTWPQKEYNISDCFDTRETRYLCVDQWFAAPEDVEQTVHNLMYTVNMKSQYFYTFSSPRNSLGTVTYSLGTVTLSVQSLTVSVLSLTVSVLSLTVSVL